MNREYVTEQQLPRVLCLAALLVGLLELGSCTDGSTPALAPDDVAAGLAGSAAAGAGIDPALWAELTAELERVLEQEGTARRTSAAPIGEGSVVPDVAIYNNGVDIVTGWSYRQQGDYDLNRLVSISDLTPVGVHFGKTTQSDDWLLAQLADGDNNGAVTISDVTPIGQNFGGRVDGFELQEKLDGPDTEFVLVNRLGFLGGDPATGQYPRFEWPLSGVLPGARYRVLPYVAVGSDFEYGVASVEFVVGESGRYNWPTHQEGVKRLGLSAAEGPTAATEDWTLVVPGQAFTNQIVSDWQDTVYCVTNSTIVGPSPLEGESYLHAVSFDGQLRWRHTFPSPALTTPSVGSRGNIVMGDAAGKVYNFAPDGKLHWISQMASPVFYSSPLFDSSGNVYLVCNDLEVVNSRLYRFDSEGVEQWNTPLLDHCLVPPLFDNVNRALTIDKVGQVSTFLSDGTPSFSTALGNGLGFFHSPMMSGSNLIASTDGQQLQLIPFGIGAPAVHVAGDDVMGAPSANVDGEIAVLIDDSSVPEGSILRLLNSALGFIWDTPIGGTCVGTIAIDSENRMYFGANDFDEPILSGGRVYCIGRDQSIVWFYPTGDNSVISPSIVGEGRLAFIMSEGFIETGETSTMVMISTAPE